MLYFCYVYLFTYAGAQHDLQNKWYSCRVKVTQLEKLVEQELLTVTGARFLRH
jgi:hypothetical protein